MPSLLQRCSLHCATESFHLQCMNFSGQSDATWSLRWGLHIHRHIMYSLKLRGRNQLMKSDTPVEWSSSSDAGAEEQLFFAVTLRQVHTHNTQQKQGFVRQCHTATIVQHMPCHASVKGCRRKISGVYKVKVCRINQSYWWWYHCCRWMLLALTPGLGC